MIEPYCNCECLFSDYKCDSMFITQNLETAEKVYIEKIYQEEILFGAAGIMGLKIFFQFSLVAQSCPTLCDPMNHSSPGLPVHHQLPEFTQTHAHRVGDAIQLSHPLSSPSRPAPNPSQHQNLFQ